MNACPSFTSNARTSGDRCPAPESRVRICSAPSQKNRVTGIVLVLLLFAAVLCEGTAARAAGDPPVFTMRGIGGAGGTYGPTIAPHDANFILLTCDMGGVYRSRDGGNSWDMIHFAQGLRWMHKAPPPVILEKRIYWVTDRKRLCRSDDQGTTWRILPEGPWEKTPAELKGKNNIVSFAVLPGKEELLLVSAQKGLWVGKDRSWRLISEEEGGPVRVYGSAVLAAVGTAGTILASRDEGRTWNALAALPGPAASLAGSSDPAGNHLILASVKNKGIFRSTDSGASWSLCKTPYENENVLAVPDGQTSLAWAMQIGSVKTQKLLRSDDGGITWQNVFIMPPPGKPKGRGDTVEPSWLQTALLWGYYFTDNGFGYAQSDPNFCMAVTQGDAYITRDGGKSWLPAIARSLPSSGGPEGRWQSIGLEVTACYGYHTDPHDPQRAYIYFADIGLGRSLDNGASWSWSAKGSPWTNTFYDLAFDPAVPGRIYAAASRRHEIYNFLGTSKTFPESRVHQGGVVVSDDFGATWNVPYSLGKDGSLPLQVCSSVILDPASPKENRTLYASIFGENEAAGVYISTNSGKTWKQTPGQPGVLPNRHLGRLALHPKTGDLYSLVTGLRAPSPDYFNPEGGGLWRSSDQGATWRHLTKGSLLCRWATAFAFDPKNEKAIYVTAATPQGGVGVGGVYKTVDGGTTWFQILDDKGALRLVPNGAPYDHFMAVAVHPDNPKLVFCGSTLKGLFISLDGGAPLSWRWCEDFPFASIQNISFDPRDSDIIYISSMGAGVWAGSVKEILRRLGR